MACFGSKSDTGAELKRASIYLHPGLDRNLELVNLEPFMGLGREAILSIAMKATKNL
jgi:hypothetical protein